MESVIQDNLFADERPTRWARFTAAPVILQAYVVFAIGATVLAMSVFIPPLSRMIVPFTGGVLILYGFTVGPAIIAIVWSQPTVVFIRQRKLILAPKRKQVTAVVMLLGVFVLVGAFDLVLHLNASDVVRQGFNNPYPTYHAFRTVFTITFPTTWLLLLLSPAVRRWIKSAPADGPEPRRHQLSLTDLLYAMLVVSVSLGMSLALVGIVKERDQRLAQLGLPTPAVSTAPGQVAPTK